MVGQEEPSEEADDLRNTMSQLFERVREAGANGKYKGSEVQSRGQGQGWSSLELTCLASPRLCVQPTLF